MTEHYYIRNNQIRFRSRNFDKAICTVDDHLTAQQLCNQLNSDLEKVNLLALSSVPVALDYPKEES